MTLVYKVSGVNVDPSWYSMQLFAKFYELIINHIKLSYVDNVCMKMLKVTKFQNFIFNHCGKNTP